MTLESLHYRAGRHDKATSKIVCPNGTIAETGDVTLGIVMAREVIGHG